jgi:hypothetical protein
MFLWRMDAEKSCPNCRAAMKLVSKTPGFLSFECPKCAFVLIEVAKEDAPRTFMRRFGGEIFDPKQAGNRAQPGEVE